MERGPQYISSIRKRVQGPQYISQYGKCPQYVTVYGERGHFTQTKKNEFFMLIKSYNLSQLSAKILEGKTFAAQRNWQLNSAVFSKARNRENIN